jgi:hypothetical protein
MNTQMSIRKIATLCLWLILPFGAFCQQTFHLQKFIQLSPEFSRVPLWIQKPQAVSFEYGNPAVIMETRTPTPGPGLTLGGGLSFHSPKWNIEIGVQAIHRSYSTQITYSPGVIQGTKSVDRFAVRENMFAAQLPLMVDRYHSVGKANLYMGLGGGFGILLAKNTQYLKHFEEGGFDRSSTSLYSDRMALASLNIRVGMEWTRPSGSRFRVGPHFEYLKVFSQFEGPISTGRSATGLQLAYYWGK